MAIVVRGVGSFPLVNDHVVVGISSVGKVAELSSKIVVLVLSHPVKVGCSARLGIGRSFAVPVPMAAVTAIRIAVSTVAAVPTVHAMSVSEWDYCKLNLFEASALFFCR
jgi:hypothetical protein